MELLINPKIKSRTLCKRSDKPLFTILKLPSIFSPLQVGASLMEPDDYMLCLLHRFELIRFLEISGGDTGHAEVSKLD